MTSSPVFSSTELSFKFATPSIDLGAETEKLSPGEAAAVAAKARAAARREVRGNMMAMGGLLRTGDGMGREEENRCLVRNQSCYSVLALYILVSQTKSAQGRGRRRSPAPHWPRNGMV